MAKIKNNKAYQQFVKAGALNGTIPSAVPDSGTTSSTINKKDNYEDTGKLSNKTFRMPIQDTAQAIEIVNYYHNVQEPARKFDDVPGIKKYL